MTLTVKMDNASQIRKNFIRLIKIKNALMIKTKVNNGNSTTEEENKKDATVIPNPANGSEDSEGNASNKTKSKGVILLAEDDEFIRDIYNRIFTMNGYEVILATNGLEAMEKMQEIVPDLILLDVMMPYQNGKEVFQKIKKDDRLKNIPVVFLTNVSTEDDLEQDLLKQADKYIIKAHFTPKEVVAEVTPLIKK